MRIDIYIGRAYRKTSGLIPGVFFRLISGNLFTNLFVSKKHEEYTIERINVIYSNCGFIGIPIVNAILGTTGVFYLTAYMTVFNILLWTHGVILMTGKAKMKETIRNICTPTIFATIFGIISFMTGMLLPEIIAEPIGAIGNMNTPFAMIVAGATLAETDIKSCLKDFRVYYLTVLKLIVIPLVVCLAFVWIPLDGVVKLVPLIATACPADKVKYWLTFIFILII